MIWRLQDLDIYLLLMIKLMLKGLKIKSYMA